MQPITAADIRRLAPGAKPFYVDALVQGWPDLVDGGFNTPLRLCHFLAQMYHETGGFKITAEYTTWSREQMCKLWPDRFKPNDPVFRVKYELACRDEDEKSFKLAEMAYNDGGKLAKRLGNNEEGDGYNYRGRMFLQPTGRACYREIGQAIGCDLEEQPDLMENPKTALLAAIWYWNRYKIHQFADANSIAAVSRAINRGNPYSSKPANHEKERTEAFHRVWAIWGVQSALPDLSELRLGMKSPEVGALQRQLRDLGYSPGDVDDMFGGETRRAVAAFKADWKYEHGEELEPDEVVGAKTKAALAKAEPIKRPEREQMTADDLRERGSTEVAAGDGLKKVGVMLTAAAVTDGAAKNGGDAVVKDTLSAVPGYKAMLEPAIEGTKWLASHWLWAIVLVGGIWLYYGGHKVIAARLNAARKGLNLSR